MFSWFTKRRAQIRNAHNLYGSIVAMTREPALYDTLKVPDTLEMRFELLVLHMFVFLRRLSRSDEQTGPLRQALVDRFFQDMEITSRQIGVGDLSVPKKMRKLATVYTERMEEYREAEEQGSFKGLPDLLQEIFYAESPKASDCSNDLAAYIEAVAKNLDIIPLRELIANPESSNNTKAMVKQ